MPMTVGTWSSRQSKRFALKICGTMTTSASVTASPSAYLPDFLSATSRASIDASPCSTQCRYHAFFCSSLTFRSRTRYRRTRRLFSGWISQAIASAIERT